MNQEQIRAEAIEALRNVGRTRMQMEAAIRSAENAIFRLKESLETLANLETCAKAIIVETND
jgi:hypothetical protein